MSMISPHRTASTRWAAGMQNARAIAPRLRRRCSARPRVPDVPHDQARRDGSGAVDLPLDRRGARWTVMGHGQRAARCYLSVHAACAPGEPVVTQRRCRRRGEFAFCAPCLHSLRRNSDAIGVKRTSGGGVRGVDLARLTQGGHERAAFAAIHGSNLLYSPCSLGLGSAR
jgi:hypothetical protein